MQTKSCNIQTITFTILATPKRLHGHAPPKTHSTSQTPIPRLKQLIRQPCTKSSQVAARANFPHQFFFFSFFMVGNKTYQAAYCSHTQRAQYYVKKYHIDKRNFCTWHNTTANGKIQHKHSRNTSEIQQEPSRRNPAETKEECEERAHRSHAHVDSSQC